MKKQKVAVIFGGCSSEYGISLESAGAVVSHMDKNRFEPVPVGITREGDWYHFTGAVSRIAADTWTGADCGTLAGALCMDKDRAHRLAAMSGVLDPQSRIFSETYDALQAFAFAGRLGYPLFVKPVKAGSSCGVAKVLVPKELETAMKDAFRYDDQVMLEENIPGFEVGCAVMGNADTITGVIDEIELAAEQERNRGTTGI